jgi:hypothetical protein
MTARAPGLAPDTGPAPAAVPSSPSKPGDRTQRWTWDRRTRRGWAQWRGWLAVAAVIAAGVTIIALAHQPPATEYLSPDSVAPSGTHALADVLAGLGREVQLERTVPAAITAATAGSTLVITSPRYLSATELAALARVPATVLLVGPTGPALVAIDPIVTLVGPPQPVVVTSPDCTLRAAVLAGSVDAGGANMFVLTTTAPVQQCYTSLNGTTLVQSRVRGRLVTVLGAAALLTNADLARQGNAALAINLLATRRIVWLVPRAVEAPAGPASSRASASRSFFSLVPLAAYLVAAQLVLALLLAAAWRARRLGPLVSEPLPVVVHASETVIGHGRLYLARHARGHTAAALRGAMLRRLIPALGLAADASSEAVTAAVAQRSAASPERIGELLYGPPPRTDAALVRLARSLDDLAREVGLT